MEQKYQTLIQDGLNSIKQSSEQSPRKSLKEKNSQSQNKPDKQSIEITKRRIVTQHIERLGTTINHQRWDSQQLKQLPKIESHSSFRQQSNKRQFREKRQTQKLAWNLGVTWKNLNNKTKDECENFSNRIIQELQTGTVKNGLNQSVFVANTLLAIQEDLMAKTQDLKKKESGDLQKMLKSANTEIKMAMYKISRCVDSGDFHIPLKINTPIILNITENIPTNCKLALNGEQCPLFVDFIKVGRGDLYFYASFKNYEPTESNHDFMFLNQKTIKIKQVNPSQIQAPRNPSEKFRMKIKGCHQDFFMAKQIYISLVTDVTMSVKVQLSFPNHLHLNSPIAHQIVSDTKQIKKDKKLQFEIQQALNQPQLAQEKIQKMREIQNQRKMLKLASSDQVQRDVNQEHKNLIMHWNQNLDTKQQISYITMMEKREFAQQKKESLIIKKKQKIEEQSQKWDFFRLRKKELINQFILKTIEIKALFRFIKLISTFQAVKTVFQKFNNHILALQKMKQLKHVGMKILIGIKRWIRKAFGSSKLINLHKRHKRLYRNALSFNLPLLKPMAESEAKIDLFLPFLRHACKAIELNFKVAKVAKQIKFIRDKFLHQLVRHQGKLQHLQIIWDKELEQILIELIKDKSKFGKEKYKIHINIDKKLSAMLRKKYLERCKFKYVLAFMQWRALQYNSNYDELQQIFQDRYTMLIQSLKTAKNKKIRDQFNEIDILSNKNIKLNYDVLSDDEETTEFKRNFEKTRALKIMMKIGINQLDTVNTFEEIGWFDPDIEPRQASTNALKWLKSIKFETHIYPVHLMKENSQPSCIFVPSKELLRKMISAVVRCKTEQEVREAFNF